MNAEPALWLIGALLVTGLGIFAGLFAWMVRSQGRVAGLISGLDATIRGITPRMDRLEGALDKIADALGSMGRDGAEFRTKIAALERELERYREWKHNVADKKHELVDRLWQRHMERTNRGDT